MSIFYCNRCDTVQDSDIVGIVAMNDGKEACDIEPYTYDEPYDDAVLRAGREGDSEETVEVLYSDVVLLNALKVYYPNLVVAMNTKITQKNNFQQEA